MRSWRRSAPGSPPSEPFRPVTIRRVLAGDDTVVVIWDGRRTANGGQRYKNSFAWVITAVTRSRSGTGERVSADRWYWGTLKDNSQAG